MKIVTLVENHTANKNLKAEHGLSLYIETENHKILFDTGRSDLFMLNAKKMKIDLAEVDMVVISHAHYDHVGGLIHFLEFNQKAKIYLKKEVFQSQYYSVENGITKHIGTLSKLLEFSNRFVYLETACTLIENLFIISNFDKHYPAPKSNRSLYKKNGGALIPDDFDHELIYVIHSEKGLLVLSGCAHNGILNIVSTVKRFFPSKKIHLVLSGFHLIDSVDPLSTESDEEILFIGNHLKLLQPNTLFYTGYCTSERAYSILSSIMHQKLHRISTGSVVTI